MPRFETFGKNNYVKCDTFCSNTITVIVRNLIKYLNSPGTD